MAYVLVLNFTKAAGYRKACRQTLLRRTGTHARKDVPHEPAETGACTKAASERATETGRRGEVLTQVTVGLYGPRV